MLLFLIWSWSFRLLKPLPLDLTANDPDEDVSKLLGSLLWGQVSIWMMQVWPKLVFLDDLAGDDERLARAAPFLGGWLRLVLIRHRKGPAFPRIEH